MNKKKPILFTTLGYPGSGKTYFAEKFAKEFNLFHLNSDKVRLEIFPDPKRTPEEHEIVYRLMDYIAEEFLKKGIGVIYDANMTKIEFRRRLMDLAKKCSANYLLLWFQTPEELAIERIKKRSNFKSESFKKVSCTYN